MPWDKATILIDTKNTTKEKLGKFSVKCKENDHCILKDWKPIECEEIVTNHLSDKSSFQSMCRTLKTQQ